MSAPRVDRAGPPAALQRSVVRVVDLDKRYPGIHALKSVNLDFKVGEIHALVGENGAGKSTLVKVLTGQVQPDGGQLLIGERHVHLHGPRSARQNGISVVPQEVEGIPAFTVGRSVTLGLEPFWVSRSRLSGAERDAVRAALDRVGAQMPESLPVERTSIPMLRLCQLARTLIDPGQLVILDEPTAVLSETDAEALLHRLLALKDGGKSILYVSHRLDEVLRIADRVSVLRDGRLVGTFSRGEADRERLVSLMARDQVAESRKVPSARPADASEPQTAGPVLQVSRLQSSGAFADVDFEVDQGQIVGVAGVQGSGHSLLLDALAGALPINGGEIRVMGHSILDSSVAEACQAGIRLVPEDRRGRGIVASRSLRENIALGAGVRTSRFGLRRRRAERAATQQAIEQFDIRTRNIEAPVGQLSGGNQQKVVLARALASSPRVLLLCEPTQGIDIHAKMEIRELIANLARSHGLGVVLATSEFEDLLGYADVVHVMCAGRITRSFTAEGMSYNGILAAALP